MSARGALEELLFSHVMREIYRSSEEMKPRHLYRTFWIPSFHLHVDFICRKCTCLRGCRISMWQFKCICWYPIHINHGLKYSSLTSVYFFTIYFREKLDLLDSFLFRDTYELWTYSNNDIESWIELYNLRVKRLSIK